MDCPICLSTISKNCGLFTNCCKTKFHKRCLNMWYKNCNNLKICPHCRCIDFESEIKNIISYNKMNLRSSETKNTHNVRKVIQNLLNKGDYSFENEPKIIDVIQILEIIKKYPYILIDNKKFFRVYKLKIFELFEDLKSNTYFYDDVDPRVNEKFHQILLESKKMIKILGY